MSDHGLPEDVARVLDEALADHTYDGEVAADLAGRLYRALPDFYTLPDLPPQGRLELLRLLAVLAGPLATVRQSVQELHADLFIDTADDAMVPFLAEMVGTSMVFPDAASNRRDVRGTVGWRRRKGTPGALEEMGGELTGQAVVLQEGWKRVQLAQDLNLLRPGRTTVDIRPAVVAEQADGPLDAVGHAVDVRAVGARTGRSHPRHVAHWMFPTLTLPLAEATPHDRTVVGTDLRFTFDPLGARRSLRARRPVGDRRPFTDRILDEHFNADPARWFGVDGGFTVRLTGLDAAVPLPPGAQVDRSAASSPRLVARTLTSGTPRIELLDRPTRGWRGAVRVELGLATLTSTGVTAWHPTPGAAFAQRAFLDLDASGVVASGPGSDPDPGGARVVVLRLSTADGAGRFFPGATLALSGTGAAASTAVADSELAREGFLAGAVHVRIPPVQVLSTWSALVALDGSLHAIADDSGPIEQPVEQGERRLAPAALLTTGPGVAWPSSPGRAEPVLLARAPAPGRGPVVLHGARVVRRTGTGYAGLAAGTPCALAFALRLDRPDGPVFEPFQRLAWTGADPAAATWVALSPAGLALGAAITAARLAEIAERADAEAGHAVVVVRLESASAQATCCPGEVAWSSDDGRTLLVHLPQLDAAAGTGDWPADPAYPAASELVRIGADGSTWASGSTALARLSLGDLAPLATPTGLRRRRVHRRTLCAWDNEDPTASPPLMLAPTEPGRLDIDVSHGLFALAPTEPPRAWPDGPAGGPPPPATVTVGYEDGATMHLGALPAAREPVLDRRLARPTRLVCGSGVLHRDAPLDWHTIPRYPTLAAALDAVSATWAALTGDLGGTGGPSQEEVVQVEDDATYADEAPTWPSGPTDPTAAATCTLRLTLQAAERRRPTVLVDPTAGWNAPAGPTTYDRVVVTGLALGGETWTGLRFPPTREVRLELTTILHAENTVVARAPAGGGTLRVDLCQTAGLRVEGPGELVVTDSVVDATGTEGGLAAGVAVSVPAGTSDLTRVSVGGTVATRVLEADTVIFDGDVTVEDRFHGCARYCRATTASVLPQAFKVGYDVPLRLVSRNRRDPGWWRLRGDCDPAVSAGAEDGSELGAFGSVHLAARLAGFRRRLVEYTPAGLQTGVIRMD